MSTAIKVSLLSLLQNSEISWLIHSESAVPFEEIGKYKTIGISSGASAPEILVDNFINNLKKQFSVAIEEIEIVKEKVTFKIPGKLN